MSPGRGDRNRKFVLIVEDSQTVAQLLHALVSRPEIAVSVAPDVDSALAVIASSNPDAIILDHMLHGETGIAVASVARPLGIPILVVTGSESLGVEAQYRAVGVSDFLQKPFDVAEFLAAVGTLLGGGLLGS